MAEDPVNSSGAQSRALLLSYNGAVRVQLLAYTDEKEPMAKRWYRALNTVFSRAAAFTALPELSQWYWLEDPVSFACDAGTLVFGIDRYADDDQWPVETEENDWRLSLHIIAEQPEQLCARIALAVQELLKIKVYWELGHNLPLTLTLTHEPGYTYWYAETDETGSKRYIKKTAV